MFPETFAVMFGETFAVVFAKTFAVMFVKNFALVLAKLFALLFQRTCFGVCKSSDCGFLQKYFWCFAIFSKTFAVKVFAFLFL